MFWVYRGKSGRIGPLFGQAPDMPYEQMVIRRLYSIEAWIAVAGLALYLGITEVQPRLWPR